MEQALNYYLYLDECGDQNLANFQTVCKVYG